MDNYEDIINLEHHTSKTRPKMSLHDRAAQFAPFAALTGYDAAVNETARYTEEKITLSQEQIEIINQKLFFIDSNINKEIKVSVEYFLKDSKKQGGQYIPLCDIITEIDPVNHQIIFKCGTVVSMEDILSLEILEENSNKLK